MVERSAQRPASQHRRLGAVERARLDLEHRQRRGLQRRLVPHLQGGARARTPSPRSSGPALDVQPDPDAGVPHRRQGRRHRARHHRLARAGGPAPTDRRPRRRLPRTWSPALGISAPPISVNEYAAHHARSTSRAASASYIAKFERAGVVRRPGLLVRVRHLQRAATSTYQPTASYWLYKWTATWPATWSPPPPRPTLTGLDGFAPTMPPRKTVNVVLGNESGTNTVGNDHGPGRARQRVNGQAAVHPELRPLHRR